MQFDNCSYDLTVSNAFGVVTSAVAMLTVRIPPSVTQQPVSLTVTQGNSATFTVGANGDSTLGYQWRLNSSAIASGVGAAAPAIHPCASTHASPPIVSTANPPTAPP